MASQRKKKRRPAPDRSNPREQAENAMLTTRLTQTTDADENQIDYDDIVQQSFPASDPPPGP